MRDLLDVVGSGAMLKAGSKLAWNGIFDRGFFASTPSINEIVAVVMSPGYLDAAQAAWLTSENLTGKRWLKIVGTLGFDASIDSFANYIVDNLQAAGWQVSTQGVAVDYAQTGSDARTGDTTNPATAPNGGGSIFNCLNSGDVLNCAATSLGVSTTTAVMIGAGLALLAVIAIGKATR